MRIIEDATKPMIIIDMDHTKVNFPKSFDRKMHEIVPPEILAKRNINGYMIEDIFPDTEYHKPLNDIITEEGFFLNMEPIDGAIEAVKEMEDEGFCIRVCTVPHPNSEFCINEKVAWIRKYLGEDFVRRIIFTYDKTLIYGDILIDDKPEIVGYNQSPSWTHVMFDAQHNKHLEPDYRLSDWKDWREVIYPILQKSSKI